MVNEPPVFEALKVYYIHLRIFQKLFVIDQLQTVGFWTYISGEVCRENVKLLVTGLVT